MDNDSDVTQEMTLDGNAVAGVLHEIFGLEMTANPAECANCGNVSELGGLTAFTQAPGAVLRCPACGSVVLRIVETPDAIYLDARGVTHLRMSRSPAAGT